VAPWFESLVVTVAPLRFGAGAKGKIASSLAAGVPVVVTAIAAEGMALEQGCGVLVATDAASFADCLCRISTDAALWTRLSDEALAYARHTLSLEAWQDRLDQMLRRLGL
jgi:glycosyltransferase involved in cell wall biosynthesis